MFGSRQSVRLDRQQAGNNHLISFKLMLAAFVLVILSVPADIYRLPVQLPFNLEIYRLVAIVMFGFWFTALLIDHNIKLRKTPLDGVALGVILAVFLSLLLNLYDFEPKEEFAEAIKAFSYFGSFFLLFYFIVSTLKNNHDIESLFKFIVAVGAMIGLSGIVERQTGYNIYRHLHEWIPILQEDSSQISKQLIRGSLRVAGPTAHPIAFSVLLAMILPVALHYWQTARNAVEKLLFGGASLLMITSSILTGSRTAFVGLIAVMAVFFLKSPQNRLHIATSGVITVFLVHMIFPGALSTIQTWLSPSYVEKTEVGNASGRLEDYPRITTEWQRKPLFGRGYGTFQHERFFFVDNQYLKFLVELGLLGSLGVILFFLATLRQFWRLADVGEPELRGLFLALGASVVVLIAATATFDSFGFSQVPYLFFVLVGLGTALGMNARIQGKNEFALSPIQPKR